MDENYQDKTESKLTATEDKLWLSPFRKNLFAERMGLKGKTLWDWMDLLSKLAVPIVVVLVTIGFGWWQAHLGNLQRQSDRHRVLDNQRATILQTCLEDIKDLLLNKSLKVSKPEDEVRVVARAEVLLAVRQLDEERKGLLMLFLSEAGLITSNSKYENVIINLTFADLSGAHLRSADLHGANLSGADLSDANLRNADLYDTSLSGADLSDANLRNADLHGANLSGADLSDANLRNADLDDTSLSGVDLSRVNLRGANLSSTRNLTQQQLDQVYTCKGTILPKGLTCHHNP